MEPVTNEFSWIVSDSDGMGEHPILEALEQWSVDDFSDIVIDEDL